MKAVVEIAALAMADVSKNLRREIGWCFCDIILTSFQ